MLPYFHSTGHLNYAKSAHVYLQDSFQLLSALSPSEYEKFITKGYFTIRRSDKFWSGIWSDMTIEQILMRSMKSSGGLTGGRGISPSTIATWIKSMPACSRIVEAVEAFAGVETNTSDQHVELREASQKRNAKDIKIFVEWLCEHNPFSKNPSLSSLSTGVVADANVNCDEAYQIGVAAIKEIEGKKFSDIHLKRKHTVKSLAHVTRSIPLRNETVCVNPNQLLHRMVCSVRSCEQLAEIFHYELCTYPPSLFDEAGLMRKGNKSSIVKVLAPKANEISNEKSKGECIIVDGGHLLHRVVWQRPATFRTICEQYTRYVLTHFGKCTVIFDGYEQQLSTKDEEHIRRSASITHIRVNVENDIQVTLAQGDFFSCSENKIQFISLLQSHLQDVGCHVLQADGDADSLIVSTTLSKAQDTNPTTLIGDDTDLLILLTVLAPRGNKIRMVSPGKNNEQDKCYQISTIQHHIGDMKDILLVVYAFTGIDTVSSIYRKGKITPFKKVQANKTLREKLLVFNDSNASPNDIAEAGELFFVILYGSDDQISLDKLRYQLYVKQIGKQPLHAQFNLAALPPTTAAAKEHSKRVYHQVQQWFGVTKDPLQWGWKKHQDHLRPVTTAKAAAPEDLLHLISCCCTDDCDRSCECKSSGLQCSNMCSQCAGHGCNNRDSATELCSDDDWPVAGDELLLELPDTIAPPEH